MNRLLECHWLLTSTALLALVSTSSLALTGSGSPASPYLIGSYAEFQEFADPCNAASYWASGICTRLEADVDLDLALPGRISYNTAVIAPDTITGNSTCDGASYAGTFDGNNHKLINMTISETTGTNWYLALFGRLAPSASIENLKLINVSITAGNNARYVAGLVALNGEPSVSPGPQITNCSVSGTITAGNNCYHIAGLVAMNWFGGITECSTSGQINCGAYTEWIGGLCANDTTGVTARTSANVNITAGTGAKKVGGFVGQIVNSNAYFTDCYATGNITAGESVHYAGGFCGDNRYGILTNCYYAGKIKVQSYGTMYLAAFVGYNDTGNLTNCLWDSDKAGVTVGYNLHPTYPGVLINVYGRTTAQMQTQITFSSIGYDFSNTDGDAADWYMRSIAADYPRLAWNYPAGDVNEDTRVDSLDFAILAAHWGTDTSSPDWLPICDLDANGPSAGLIDMADTAALVSNWLAGV